VKAVTHPSSRNGHRRRRRAGRPLAGLAECDRCNGGRLHRYRPQLRFANGGHVELGVHVTITNNSATNHTISSLNLSGSDAGQFSLSNNTCPGALNAGSQCTVDVTFTPTTIGAKSAQIDVVDEAGTTSGVALLDGTGISLPSVQVVIPVGTVHL
jgi:hypothetical protein